MLTSITDRLHMNRVPVPSWSLRGYTLCQVYNLTHPLKSFPLFFNPKIPNTNNKTFCPMINVKCFVENHKQYLNNTHPRGCLNIRSKKTLVSATYFDLIFAV